MRKDSQVTINELSEIAFCLELTRSEKFFLIAYLLIYGFHEIKGFKVEIAAEMQIELDLAKVRMKQLKAKGIFEIKSHGPGGITIKANRGSWNRIKHRR